VYQTLVQGTPSWCRRDKVVQAIMGKADVYVWPTVTHATHTTVEAGVARQGTASLVVFAFLTSRHSSLDLGVL
jgi:hypothetical protein